MPRYHGQHGYGPVIRIFHWLTAILIGAAALRGVTMIALPATTDAEVARIFSAFSLHKTLGIAALAVILLHMIARLVTRDPGPLHPERRAEVFLARTTQLVMWGGMILLPLSGWLRHASAPGFAPILWPFGQSLPGVPADERLSLIFQTVHLYAGWTLAAAVALHIIGAARHAVLDQDATLARITTGAGPYAPPAGFPMVPLGIAALLWMAVLAYGLRQAPEPIPDPFVDFQGGAELQTAPEPDLSAASPAGQDAEVPLDTDQETIDMPRPPSD
ncbi:cytochrome b/b6 domain-containing protein [Defluviimonas sp. WL0002]|uniref:Cytochrome b/b6 domain-containing protein n=1 Tax=Albidovulum marisflavi TaxID=2984159 RepID=A0ABT2ZBR5_9RHOB|nr:cytochrome b/b6 domain-containing protein [Defluviimonas sp. WL0002]MCV2868518.1 cytochrome b/b6 domain-containing protein [Defluviimonas sp. WL0002]